MDENEIVDVEVEEEVLCTLSDEEDEQEPLTDMAFHDLLNETYTTFKQHNYVYDAHIQDDLHTLLLQAKEDMDANSLTKLLFMCGRKYEQEGNKNARSYCAMRMQEIKDQCAGKKKHKPSLLQLNTIEENATREKFISDYTAFIQPVVEDMSKKLGLITLGMFALLFVFLVFILKISYVIALVEAVVVGIFVYFMNRKRLPDMFWRKQLEVLAQHIEPDLAQLDAPIRFS